jgi:cell wall-associated NlpC family hydrolase
VHERTSHRRRRKTGTGSIALSLGLCLCAGQLVATAPASAAPVPVTAAAAAAAAKTVKPRITNSYNRKSIAAGKTVRVTTKLVNPKTGKAVTGKVKLQIRGGKVWKTWVTRSTNAKGVASFLTKPGGSLYYRTIFAGTKGFASVRSGQTKITVKNNAAKVLTEAAKHKGARYVFGAAGPRQFDCSGYTMYVYKKAAGKKLPHKANSQQKYGKAVSKSNKKAGDLLVFRSGSYGTHVGIYAGGGYMWASPRAGKTVQKQKVYSNSYVVRRLVSA